ncbi:hypothetical protein [Nonomuraea fuscirosea]|uniref:hypothetical protein n=1 Tax=Nonomuraea fuscirosea TaxID=1291556 RepID=UPI0034282F86
MNDMLREDLHALAEQAPTVDLAARAVRGARRRRTTRLAVLTGAVLTCLAVVGGGVIPALLRPAPPIVMTPPETNALPLPADGVGPVRYAYRSTCSGDSCAKTRWRIVTRQGDAYRLGDDVAGPLQVTADGRRIAYYSTKHHRIIVRDLASGRTWQAPLKQPKEDFDVEYALRLSPDGLRFIVSGWGGRREPNKLVDVRRGTVTDLAKGWWPVSVANGSGPVVLAKPYDMTSQVWVLGHDPIPIPYFTYNYSGLAPDGRTLARVGQTFDRNRAPMVRVDGTIVTFDATRRGAERRTKISGLPEGWHPRRFGGWLSDTEVTMLAVAEPVVVTPGGARRPSRGGNAVYAVDVRTGASRELFTLPQDGVWMVPGLVV